VFRFNDADEVDMEKVVNLLVVSEQPGQSAPCIKAACKAGWRIACESSYEQLSSVLASVQAEDVFSRSAHKTRVKDEGLREQ
jgi:hypothetical protein